MTKATLIRYLSTYFDLTEYMDEAEAAAQRFLSGSDVEPEDRLERMMFEDLCRHFLRFPEDEFSY